MNLINFNITTLPLRANHLLIIKWQCFSNHLECLFSGNWPFTDLDSEHENYHTTSFSQTNSPAN